MDNLNEQIAKTVAEAENFLESLGLTEEEKLWAKKQAKIIVHDTSESMIEERDFTKDSGPKIVPAAIAYALIISRDWAENLRQKLDQIANEKKR